MSPKLPNSHPQDCSLQISQAECPKTNKWFDIMLSGKWLLSSTIGRATVTNLTV